MIRPTSIVAVLLVLVSPHAWAAECEAYYQNQASRVTKDFMESAERAASAGEHEGALLELEKAHCAAQQSINPGDLIAVNAALGRALVKQGSLTSAYPYLKDGAELASSTGRESEAAALFNDLGVLERSRNQIGAASEAFSQSYALADEGSRLRAVAGINLARAKLENEGLRAGRVQLELAETDVRRLPGSQAKAMALLSLAESYRLAADLAGDSIELRTTALEHYKSALAIADERADARLVSYSLGYMARLYRDQGDQDAALELSRRAVYAAQESDVVDGEFLWQWETGQMLREYGRENLALTSYELAADALRRLGERYGQYSSEQFKEQVRPFYLEYTDLLLSSSTGDGSADQQNNLEFVLTLMEEVKVAETQEYFDDVCACSTNRNIKPAELSANIAVITPIVFRDRIEVLTRVNDRVQRHTTKVRKRDLRKTVNAFRRGIVERTPDVYQESGKQIYDWLVAPQVEAMRAAKIDTLVLVPDDAFLSIPPSALYDGEKYLIEEFSVSTVLSLSQTNISTTARIEAPRALVSGLTESVQGFDALPAVASEIDNIAASLDSTVYENATFQKQTLQSALADSDYGIVHIATHAQFQSDYRESFLLTYDGKLPMNELDQAIRNRAEAGQPLDLIVLSACETAVGDNLAALGLAGITVKAGAKSSIASLWPVNDASTSAFMKELYTQVAMPDIGKADAVRLAQLSLLEQEEYSEPYYWAAFMLVGDWL